MQLRLSRARGGACDGRNMHLIAERLKSEAQSGRTILVITHDRELIESCCDNVVEVGTKPSEVQ